MLASGDTLDTLNLWFAFPGPLACTMDRDGEETLQTIVWRISIWDALSMARGEFLDYDWGGTPIADVIVRTQFRGRIAGDYFVGWIQVAADLDFLLKDLKFPHWGNETPCKWCTANTSTNLWSDFRSSAAWKRFLTTKEQWAAAPL